MPPGAVEEHSTVIAHRTVTWTITVFHIIVSIRCAEPLTIVEICKWISSCTVRLISRHRDRGCSRCPHLQLRTGHTWQRQCSLPSLQGPPSVEVGHHSGESRGTRCPVQASIPPPGCQSHFCSQSSCDKSLRCHLVSSEVLSSLLRLSPCRSRH